MKKIDSITRFEVINTLYMRRTGKMRPGKSASPVTREEPNSEENWERFDQWLSRSSFSDAINYIAHLEDKIKGMEEADESN